MGKIISQLLILTLLAGCSGIDSLESSNLGAADPKILVLIPQPSSAQISFASRRYTHKNKYSQIPLGIREKIDALEASGNMREVDGWQIETLGVYCAVFKISPSQRMEDIIENLSSDEEILFAQPMNYFKALGKPSPKTVNDPYASIQYGHHLADLQALHQYSKGKNVKVGIIDSSVDQTHPDLQGQIKSNVKLVSDDNKHNALHGTAIAGLISAIANNGEGGLGLAPEAELFVYGACRQHEGKGTMCDTLSIAKGLSMALKGHVDILNLSLAGPYDPLIEKLLNKMLRQDVIVIAAENPNGSEMHFPASMPGVISVGSLALQKLETAGGIAPLNDAWYRRDEWLSTRAGGGYQFFYGNSLSAAGVSGIAALIRSKYSEEDTVGWLSVATQNSCRLSPTTDEGSDFYVILRKVLGCEKDSQIEKWATVNDPDHLINKSIR